MKTTGRIIAVLMVLMGTIWFLQGISVLPGSFMTGQTRWAVYGAICWVAGVALLWICRRARRTPPPR